MNRNLILKIIYLRRLYLPILGILFSLSAFAQESINVNGMVTSVDNHDPLIGVTVIVKGTTKGATTNVNGQYSISANQEDTLVFSYIGYTIKQVAVGNRSTINVELQTAAKGLNEVVVVGYGTEKKKNLTGAITQISGEVFESKPISNVGQGLEGTVANLNVKIPSGKPGQPATINVRGTTSINGGSALVLVDGVQMDPNLINPQDIASVTVLKDAASSAIYGARAAYGVVLITTKAGQKNQTPIISYNNNFAFKTFTRVPDFVNGIEHYDFQNTLTMNTNGSLFYPAEMRQYIVNHMRNPSKYPASEPNSEVGGGWGGTAGANGWSYNGNTDWIKELFKEWAPQQQHNVSVRGGGKRVSYYLSGSMFHQDGLFRYGTDTYKKYNFNANIKVELKDWWTIGAKSLINKSAYNKASVPNDRSLSTFIAWYQQPPIAPVKNPDGHYAYWFNFPYYLSSEGRDITSKNDSWIMLNTELRPFKGMSIKANYNYENWTRMRKNHLKTLYYYTPDGSTIPDGKTTPNQITESTASYTYRAINLYADYEKTFGSSHYFKALIGYNYETATYHNYDASRQDLLTDAVPSLNLATGKQFTSSGGYDWAILGVFYRINYIYKDRYLFEADGRYDGTSKFPENSRFGFFPSASIGWRISNEKFMKFMQPLVNELKFRVSYGSLGNQAVSSNYPYIPSLGYNATPSYLFHNDYQTAFYPAGLVSANLTWEKVTSIDAGFDYSMLNNRFTTAFDWYQRSTNGMLASVTLPAVLGTSAPKINQAGLKTTGFELTLGWKDGIGKDFKYNISINVGDYQAVITKFNNPSGILNSYNVGEKIGTIWGYQTAGIFTSQSQIEKAPPQTAINAGTWKPGDIQYADLNKDGKIDYGKNTLSDHGDLKIIGNSTPHYSYGITLGAQWKGLDISIFAQGIGERKIMPSGAAFWGYSNIWQVAREVNLDYWREDNLDAYFPRPILDGRNTQNQTRYLQSAAYMRLKNLTIGYTIPSALTKKLYINTARVFFSGQNLFEITKLLKGIDPEAIDNPTLYPFQRTLSFGISIQL